MTFDTEKVIANANARFERERQFKSSTMQELTAWHEEYERDAFFANLVKEKIEGIMRKEAIKK